VKRRTLEEAPAELFRVIASLEEASGGNVCEALRKSLGKLEVDPLVKAACQKHRQDHRHMALLDEAEEIGARRQDKAVDGSW
jgi:hypothetical protein